MDDTTKTPKLPRVTNKPARAAAGTATVSGENQSEAVGAAPPKAAARGRKGPGSRPRPVQLTPEEQREAAKLAAALRWGPKRKA